MPQRHRFSSLIRLRLLTRALLTWALLTGPLQAGVAPTAPSVARDDQSSLAPVINAGDNLLRFDWPTVLIGTGEYQEGPTGVTVFRFAKPVFAAVDARGGGPGTVNSDFLRIGYEVPEVDAIVFSGGSWYGLEGATAVGTALKDDGIRGGNWDNIALSVGSIIYDFGDRRLNEVYPDKRLAQAAARAVRPGTFPLGARGAGRMAKTGHIFGCGAYSGQGGAFRQIGDLKIAAFTVVNAVGVVTRRDGRVAACYPDTNWPQELRTGDLLAAFPASSKPGGWNPVAKQMDAKRNTTVSLVITNQKLDRARLERLAAQVHTSMGRALQPFATEFDGDVLYAVSTAELDQPADAAPVPPVDLDIIASELMWDAVLASIPPQQTAVKPAKGLALRSSDLQAYAGEYTFSPVVRVRVTVVGNKLFAQATGERKAFAIDRNAPVELLPVSATEFMVPGRYPTTLSFATAGKLVMNPGHWQQSGVQQ